MRAKFLILDIVRAQRVAVHQQDAFAVEIDDGGIVEQGHSRALRVVLAEQEIAIAVHEINRHAMSLQRT